VMKRRVIGALAVASSVCALAQGNELVVVPNVKAAKLAGVVVSTYGSPIAGVSVVRFACGEKFQGALNIHADQRTETGSDGRFHLDWGPQAIVCVQFQTPGMNTLQIQVHKSVFAGELHPRLVPGT
jgi:hypothetical protein